MLFLVNQAVTNALHSSGLTRKADISIIPLDIFPHNYIKSHLYELKMFVLVVN